VAASATLKCLATQRKLHSCFLEGVHNVASICLQIGYPAVASVPHSIIMYTGRSWICLCRLITSSHLLKMSRGLPGRSICIRGSCPKPLPPPLLFLPAAPAKVEAKKSPRSQRRIWVLVSLINHQKATNSTSQLYLSNKEIKRLD
uniref:Uncharacterized protein n=1 Tax=Lynx canadensis TaxID=61383 RepID=A0A667I7N1_LYNCA